MPPIVKYWNLTGLEFEDAIYGTADAGPSLEVPTLKYYHAWPSIGPKVERQVFVAAAGAEALAKPVGMLETTVSPYDERELWLMYVTVDPVFQRRGIAQELIKQLIAHLKKQPRILVRSRSSESAPEGFQDFVDRILNAARIPWRQGDRSANLPLN